ncbi:MAG: MmcQ/YjbR family DNA-binding protein [Candidatus Izemoplasmatales bacterium]|jgi:predicted DNA-binding protein (MmcQ/YjbR family)|nr:MmcQ/YjbR family DNA-binding protein [Candidatus Izemoplasmatales bacterium]
MHDSWIHAYCLAKAGTDVEFKFEWEASLYRVGGKMFALLGENKEKKPILSLKLEPSYGVLLREMYPCIQPGYYLNKVHWNSIEIENHLGDAFMKELIDQSYAIISASLPIKVQKALGINL